VVDAHLIVVAGPTGATVLTADGGHLSPLGSGH
jgi:hypothetical protein